MTEYYTYITKQDDRWDLIAYKFYKNANQFEQIIQANPNIERTAILSAGIKLKIPVINESSTISFDSPPWKK